MVIGSRDTMTQMTAYRLTRMPHHLIYHDTRHDTCEENKKALTLLACTAALLMAWHSKNNVGKAEPAGLKAHS